MNALLLASILFNATPEVQSVQRYLQCGAIAMEQLDWETSVFCHEKAIATGTLNDIGSAVAYWNIFVSEEKLENVDNSMNALLSYIVYGLLVMDDPRYEEMANGFFIELKLNFAADKIYTTWAERKTNGL